MTKQEFKAIRGYYRGTCGAAYRRAQARAASGFILDNETMALYEYAGKLLADFASLLHCDKLTAVDILNMRNK